MLSGIVVAIGVHIAVASSINIFVTITITKQWRCQSLEVGGGKQMEWWFRRWDTYENVRVGVIGSAEGAKLRLPKARSPSRLGGLGERRKLYY